MEKVSREGCWEVKGEKGEGDTFIGVLELAGLCHDLSGM